MPHASPIRKNFESLSKKVRQDAKRAARIDALERLIQGEPQPPPSARLGRTALIDPPQRKPTSRWLAQAAARAVTAYSSSHHHRARILVDAPHIPCTRIFGDDQH